MATKDVEGAAMPGKYENSVPREGKEWRHEMMQKNNALDAEHKFAGTSDRSGKWVRQQSSLAVQHQQTTRAAVCDLDMLAHT